MIVVRIMGGLGNQLFQYAAGRSLAAHHNTHLKLDLNWFDEILSRNDVTKRKYELSKFSLVGDVASQQEIENISYNPYDNSLKGIFFRLLRKLNLHQSTYFAEKDFTRFDQNFFKTKKNTYLMGYWAQEKYFQHIEATIRREFTLKVDVSHESKQIADDIHNGESVSLHIRRGDYLTQNNQQSLFYVLPIDYYRSAIQYIQNELKDFHVFIFSDDPDWVKDHLRFDTPTTFVTHNTDNHAHEDMWLMSLCKHHIIANSTFSWWGAWLSKNTDKLIIAPKQWYSPQSTKSPSLPSNWVRL